MKFIYALMVWFVVANGRYLNDSSHFGSTEYSYVNQHYEPMIFECVDNNRGINYMVSEWVSSKDDRKFGFDCTDNLDPNNCGTCSEWSLWANELRQNVYVTCQEGYYMTAIFSLHGNGDRRWKIKCCTLSTIELTGCAWTPAMNSLESYFIYQLPEGTVATGLDSWFEGKKDDRTFKFQYCYTSSKAEMSKSNQIDHQVQEPEYASAVTDAKAIDFLDGNVNDYDETFVYQCPHNIYGITSLVSTHSSSYEDRIFEYGCSGMLYDGCAECYWSGYVNPFDGDVDYSCPADSYLEGVMSWPHNQYEDRKFQFRCCSMENLYLEDCEWTDFLNDWDGPISYTVPTGRVMAGQYSGHSNSKEDRRFKARHCKVVIGEPDVSSYTITEVNYYLEDADIVNNEPLGMGSTTVTNNDAQSQDGTLEVKYEYTETSEWTHGRGWAAGVSLSVTAKIPFFTDSTVELSQEKTVNYGFGESFSDSLSSSLALQVKIPAYHQCTMTVVARQYTSDVPYDGFTTTFYSDDTSSSEYITGIYKGVSVNDFEGIIDPCVPISE